MHHYICMHFLHTDLIYFLRCWQGEFAQQSRASFLYSCDLNFLFRMIFNGERRCWSIFGIEGSNGMGYCITLHKNACNHDLFDGNIFNEAKRKLWGFYCRTVVGQVTWMIKVEISHFSFLSFLLRKFFVETLLADDNNSSGFYCILTKLFHYFGTNCWLQRVEH